MTILNLEEFISDKSNLKKFPLPDLFRVLAHPSIGEDKQEVIVDFLVLQKPLPISQLEILIYKLAGRDAHCSSVLLLSSVAVQSKDREVVDFFLDTLEDFRDGESRKKEREEFLQNVLEKSRRLYLRFMDNRKSFLSKVTMLDLYENKIVNFKRRPVMINFNNHSVVQFKPQPTVKPYKQFFYQRKAMAS